MGAGVRPIPLPPDEAGLSAHDLWNYKVQQGLTPDSATKYVSTFHGPPPSAPADATAYNANPNASIVGQIGRGARDLAIGAVSAPVQSFFNAVVAPGVGEARPDPRLSKGGNSSGAPLNQPAYDAEHGAVTSAQRAQAGLQTVANVAAPAIAKLPGGVPLSGAAVGASYDPAHPVQGALLGATTAAALHGGGKVLGKTASALLDATGARPVSYANTPQLGNLGRQFAQKLLFPLTNDPSLGLGEPHQGPVLPDAMAGEIPILATRRINGPEPTAPPVTGRSILRGTARALGVQSTEERSMGMILDAMNKDGLGLSDAIARVAQQTGQKPETLMDIAGQNVIGLARGASMVPGSAAKNDIPQRLFDRSTGQHERLMQDAEELAGVGQPENARKTFEQILQDRNTAADAAGADLRQMEPQQVPGLEQLAGRPSMQAAERLARNYAAERGQSMAPIFDRSPDQNITVSPDQMRQALQQTGGDADAAARMLAEQSTSSAKARPLSFQEVTDLKRAFDSMSKASKRFGQMQTGPNLESMTSDEYHQALVGNTTNAFLKGLDGKGGADAAFDGYADLRKNYGDATSLAKAVEWGKSLLKMNPDDAEVEFQNMGPAEQEMARRSGLRALQNYIESKSDARDVTGALDPTTMRRRLTLLFGDNMPAFGQRLAQEARMNATRGAIRGQSNTADKLAELANVAGFSLDDLANLATGNVGGLAKRLLSKTAASRMQGYTQATANALSDRVTAGAPGAPRSLSDVLSELQTFENNRFLRAAKRGNAGAAVRSGAANTAARNDPFNR